MKNILSYYLIICYESLISPRVWVGEWYKGHNDIIFVF